MKRVTYCESEPVIALYEKIAKKKKISVSAIIREANEQYLLKLGFEV